MFPFKSDFVRNNLCKREKKSEKSQKEIGKSDKFSNGNNFPTIRIIIKI